MNRRRFITLCIASGILAGPSYYYFREESADQLDGNLSWGYEFLNEDDERVLMALTPVFVSGAKPSDHQLEFTEVLQVIRNIDSVLQLLPQGSRDEVRALLDLLSNRAGRMFAAGVWDSWQNASPGDIDTFLLDWRNSWLALFQTAYQGLHQLILGSYYAEQHAWKVMSYPGPPKIQP